MTLAWLRTKVSQRCFGSGVRIGPSLWRYLPTVRGETSMVSLSFNSLAMRSSPQVGFSAAISRMSLRRSLGIRGLPTGRHFQRQKRRNPLRCQRRKVSGLTFTRASRQENMRPRMTIISRVESWARCGLSLRSWNKASCLRRKRFSAASARRDRETSTRRWMRSRATEDSVARLRVNVRNLEPDMNAQLYTLRDLTRLPTGGRAKFLRTTTVDDSLSQALQA